MAMTTSSLKLVAIVQELFVISYPVPGTLPRAQSQLVGHREKSDEKSGPLEGALRAKVGRDRVLGVSSRKDEAGGTKPV